MNEYTIQTLPKTQYQRDQAKERKRARRNSILEGVLTTTLVAGALAFAGYCLYKNACRHYETPVPIIHKVNETRLVGE